MAIVQAAPTSVPAQARCARATTTWPPPSSGLTHTRPWRSSPLAGPAFSTLPPVILEASEESHENDVGCPDGPRVPPRPRSPSLASQSGSLTASGYASRNGSGSASVLIEGEASTSSASLTLIASSGAHGPSSQSHSGSSQTHSSRPSRRLSKSWRRTSLTHDLAPSPADANIAPPPRARTVSHDRSRSVSFPGPPLVPSQAIPPAYSQTTPRPPPDSDANTAKQPSSKSRDPASNWMSSSPFGPAQTPKFSRLAMASPAVVMPLSAREYRKQKARESLGPPGKGKDKDSTSTNRVTFIDNAMSAFQGPNGVPTVKVSPPQPEDVHRPPLSSPDRRSQPQLQPRHPLAKPLSQASMSPRPSSPKLRRPRPRPHTPPRSSPLAAHPPISPKSSAGTFFSATSGSDDDAVPSARPRPRLRRRSYPDRLSNGARLSLLQAMNRLSQEGTSQNRLSGHSETDAVNRLSLASQASGNTLFFEVGESEGEKGQVTSGHGNVYGSATGDGDAHGAARTPALRTQSLEDLSSTLARTGIEVARHNLGGHPDLLQSEGEGKAKRNVRTVRISDTVQVSPPPVIRRRKLTKSRPATRASTPVDEAMPGSEPESEVQAQTHTRGRTQERRKSLLPWISKGSGDGKVGAGPGTPSAEKRSETLANGAVHLNQTTPPTPVPNSHLPVADGLAHEHCKPKSSITPSKKGSASAPAAASSPDLRSFTTPRKTRRYTFSFLPSPTFNRPKREKSNTAPTKVDLGLDKPAKGNFQGSVIAMERSGTDSTSISIRTITQGSQSTLVLPSPALTTPASSGSQSGGGSRSSIPMLRRLTAQEMETAGVPSPSDWEEKRDSTPSLLTSVSTATSSSSPRTPFHFRGGAGGEPFISRPSGLKESFTDTSEEDSEGPSGGRASRMCMHRNYEPSPLAHSGVRWGELSEEDDRHLRPDVSPRLGPRPGTSSSTVTTTTEGSGSYLSFSTVPASTASSSAPSRSESPSPVADPRMSGGEGELYTCAMCGHRSASPVSARARAPSPTSDPELEGMHPMFTVPLITVPVSALDQHRASVGASASVPRYASARRRGRGSASSGIVADDAIGVSPARSNLAHPVNGVPVATSRTTGMGVKDEMGTTAMPGSPSPMTPPPPSLRMQKRHRPQTAPVSTDDAARRFVEEAQAMRAREGGIDIDVLIGHPEKGRGARESKSGLRTVLRGLLRWGDRESS